jgi:hypothetical protein
VEIRFASKIRGEVRLKINSSGETFPEDRWVSFPMYLQLTSNLTLSRIYHCMSLLESSPKGNLSNQMTTFGFFELSFITIKAVQGTAGMITHYTYEDGTPLEVEIQNHLFPRK